MPLRHVTVTYTDGTKITTSMAAGLSDKEIRNYFRVGKEFNIGDGRGGDRLVRVKKVVVHRRKP